MITIFKKNKFIFLSFPLFIQYCIAIFKATSTETEPESVKILFLIYYLTIYLIFLIVIQLDHVPTHQT